MSRQHFHAARGLYSALRIFQPKTDTAREVNVVVAAFSDIVFKQGWRRSSMSMFLAPSRLLFLKSLDFLRIHIDDPFHCARFIFTHPGQPFRQELL